MLCGNVSSCTNLSFGSKLVRLLSRTQDLWYVLVSAIHISSASYGV